MIVHLGKYSYPFLGGIERATQDISELAVRSGYQVTAIGFDCYAKRVQKVELNGVSLFKCPSLGSVLGQPLSIAYLFTAIEHATKASILHIHWPNFLVILPALICRLLRKKIVLHWHANATEKGIVSFLLYPLTVLLLLTVDVVVVTSPRYRMTLNFNKWFRKKFRVIPLSSPLTSLVSQKIDVSEPKRILCVGRFVGYKNFLNLITAISVLRLKYPSSFGKVARVDFVGSGPELVTAQKLVRDLDLHDYVFFHSNVATSELNEFWLNADLFVLPSNSTAEAFGLVLIEAKSYGLPCVVVDIVGSGVPWVVNAGVDGIVAPSGGVEDLCIALDQMLSMSEGQYLAFRSNSFEDYVLRFSPSAVEDQWVSLYRSLTYHQ